MTLSEFKNNLREVNTLLFIQPNGTTVPLHFHITEAGKVTKDFVDCGGTVRSEKKITFQLWVAMDFEHRLSPSKLLSVIDIYEKRFGADDLEVEMEYQNETVGRYGISFANGNFQLVPQKTDCLAQDKCGIPAEKIKVSLTELQSACCAPGGGCC